MDDRPTSSERATMPHTLNETEDPETRRAIDELEHFMTEDAIRRAETTDRNRLTGEQLENNDGGTAPWSSLAAPADPFDGLPPTSPLYTDPFDGLSPASPLTATFASIAAGNTHPRLTQEDFMIGGDFALEDGEPPPNLRSGLCGEQTPSISESSTSTRRRRSGSREQERRDKRRRSGSRRRQRESSIEIGEAIVGGDSRCDAQMTAAPPDPCGSANTASDSADQQDELEFDWQRATYEQVNVADLCENREFWIKTSTDKQLEIICSSKATTGAAKMLLTCVICEQQFGGTDDQVKKPKYELMTPCVARRHIKIHRPSRYACIVCQPEIKMVGESLVGIIDRRSASHR